MGDRSLPLFQYVWQLVGRFLSYLSCLRTIRLSVPNVKAGAVARRSVSRIILQVGPDADAHGTNVPVGEDQDQEDANVYLQVLRVEFIVPRSAVASD